METLFYAVCKMRRGLQHCTGTRHTAEVKYFYEEGNKQRGRSSGGESSGRAHMKPVTGYFKAFLARCFCLPDPQ